MPTQTLLALGGNLGDVRAIGRAALRQLDEVAGLRVIQVSSWYSTAPVGCEGEFLNAAALLESDLTPPELLHQLHKVEAAHGRVRTAHWAPRPLDLDLILSGTQQYDSPKLMIPHPWAWCRRFVLDPACEIAGEMLHPAAGQTLKQLRDRLRERPLRVAWSVPISWSELFGHQTLARFEQLVELVAESEQPHVHFTTQRRCVPVPFEVCLPANPQNSLTVIGQTLTAMLDEPQRL